MNRRSFFRNAASSGLMLIIGPSVLVLDGCDAQDTLVALLGELSAAYQGLASIFNLPTNAAINQAFTNAVNAVKAWVPGTAAQDVVQVLQILAADVAPILSTLTNPVFVAAGQFLLGTIVSIIELLDPNAVPPVAAAALNRKVATGVAVTTRTKHEWYEAAKAQKSGFDSGWKALQARYPQLATVKLTA